MAEYNKEARIRKLQKLLDLANHTSTNPHLARNSREMYERLIREWEIDPSVLEDEVAYERSYKYPKGTRYIAVHILHHLDITSWTYKYRKFTVYFEGTDTDYAMFKNLFEATLKHLDAKRKNMEKEIFSYMCGLVNSQYPADVPKVCFKCKAETYEYNDSEDRYECSSCGYKGKKLKRFDHDHDQYLKGLSTGQTLRKPEELIEHKKP